MLPAETATAKTYTWTPGYKESMRRLVYLKSELVYGLTLFVSAVIGLGLGLATSSQFGGCAAAAAYFGLYWARRIAVRHEQRRLDDGDEQALDRYRRSMNGRIWRSDPGRAAPR